ncbi:MAG: hypothetical protein R3E01_22760 [Pirellulaceae bacterium]|nr:hypothetical protein [Planctomycetales bacterium]
MDETLQAIVLSIASAVSIVAALTIFAAIDRLRVAKRFRATFTLIDDDEFLRRCGNGVSRNVALRVRRCVADQLGLPYKCIYPEHTFVEDLECY